MSSHFAEAMIWCHLPATIPDPPSKVRQSDAVRLRPRRRPLPRALAVLGLVALSPLILLAIVYGWAPTLSPRKRRAEKAAREDAKARNAIARQQGLHQAFDGNWSGGAGQLLLTWYQQAPDAARLLVPMANEFVLLAAPSRVWFKARARRLKVVARLPYTMARPDISHLAAKDVPHFRVTFSDGTWIALTIDDSDHIEAFLSTCRSLPYPAPKPHPYSAL
ncbi:hypothetical protein [Streptomyces zagrosensis]|uniref:hypothetical protein n=1 Tax=Streptomyces zagrosensis TaxID=1042984 RepID=UPI001622FCDB|nr:hypothetical protein [Streptomyces zagrosensis]